MREFLKKRVVEISQNVAATFRGKAEVDFVYGSPALMNDSALVDELIGYIGEILPEEMLSPNGKLGGGEDFTFVADLVPSAFFLLGELVEVGPTNQIFSTPRDKRTEDYISGRFG